jgi:hypothetical protein
MRPGHDWESACVLANHAYACWSFCKINRKKIVIVASYSCSVNKRAIGPSKKKEQSSASDRHTIHTKDIQSIREKNKKLSNTWLPLTVAVAFQVSLLIGEAQKMMVPCQEHILIFPVTHLRTRPCVPHHTPLELRDQNLVPFFCQSAVAGFIHFAFQWPVDQNDDVALALRLVIRNGSSEVVATGECGCFEPSGRSKLTETSTALYWCWWLNFVSFVRPGLGRSGHGNAVHLTCLVFWKRCFYLAPESEPIYYWLASDNMPRRPWMKFYLFEVCVSTSIHMYVL